MHGLAVLHYMEEWRKQSFVELLVLLVSATSRCLLASQELSPCDRALGTYAQSIELPMHRDLVPIHRALCALT